MTTALLLIHDEPVVGAWCESAAQSLRDDGSKVVIAKATSRADRPALAELEAQLATLANDPGVDARRIAALGFGRGGTLAFQLGCTSRRVKAVVNVAGAVLYPTLDAERPIQPLELTLNLDVPMLAVFGGRDPEVASEQVALFRQMVDQAMKNVEFALYPEASAHFYDPARSDYRPDDARDMWSRIHSFLRSSFD